MSNRVSNRDGPLATNAHYAQLPTDDPAPGPTTLALELSDAIDAGGKSVHVNGHRRAEWAFAESKWFRGIVILVFLASTGIILLELNDTHMAYTLNVENLCITAFITFELCAKWCYYGRYYLCGGWSLVIWNLLDILLVVTAAADNYLTFHPLHVQETSPSKILTILRCVRLLQIVKILNIVLDYDLSWADSPLFQSFIGIVIGFNALLMGFETDVKSDVWAPIEQCLLSIYTAELLVRMKKQGVIPFISYDNHDFVWNWLDLIIVVSSAIDSWGMGMMKLLIHAMRDTEDNGQPHKEQTGIKLSQVMMLMRMLRLLRILRLAKLVKAVKPLYILVMGVSSAIQGVFWVLLLTIVILYAMSIIATRLIGHGLVFEGHARPDEADLAVFGTVPDSMYTIFRVMNAAQTEEESAKIEALMSTLPSMKFAFVFFLVTTSWTVLSIMTAVVSEKMIGTCNEDKDAEILMSYEEDRDGHKRELMNLFKTLDPNNNGWLELKSLEQTLSDPQTAAKIAKTCRVPVHNVRDCFDTMSRHGERLSMDNFVVSMLEMEKPANQQAVNTILSQILQAQRQVDAVRSAHQDQIENLVKTVKESEQKHHEILMQVEQKNAAQEQRHAQAIMEMEKKNADQEQRHAEAVMEMERKNMQTINSILEVVNVLAARQEDIERTRLARDSDLSVRLAGVELSNNETLQALQQRIESLATLSLHSACDVSSTAADDKRLEQQSSTDIGGEMDQDSLPATSNHDDAGSREAPEPLTNGPGVVNDSGVGQAGSDAQLR